jgi:hypothetical protein
MQGPSLFIRVLLIATAAVPGGGCVAFYSHRDVTFRVVDGETEEPIPGATVRVGYEPHYFVLNKPRDRSVKTGSRGGVTVSVAKWWVHDGPSFSFAARGYLEHGESARPGERLPHNLIPCPGDAIRCFVIPLYRAPAPQIVLVVADGYAGPVAVELLPSAAFSTGPKGRRHIELDVPASGYVAIEAGPLLRRHRGLDYRARRAGGAPLPRPYFLRPDEHAFRWVRSEGNRHLFVVGPASMERQTLRRVMNVTDQPNGGITMHSDPVTFNAYFETLRREQMAQPPANARDLGPHP